MQRREPPVACVCTVCGKHFTVLAARARQGKGRFCGLTCARAGQQRKNGSVARPLEERFAEFVDKASSPDGCWTWVGRRNKHGYGILDLPGGTSALAHRLAWELEHGPISEGLAIRHVVCANPSCVRTAHLQPGTHEENMADMARDGSKKGERHHARKLTEADVQAIRAAVAFGENGEEIAARFDISYRTVRDIAAGRSWGHLTNNEGSTQPS